MLKQQLERDLKQSLLSGDKDRVATIRGLKSVILYAEVAQGVRDKGLGDNEIIALLGKEAKKRQESADFFVQGGADDRAAKELREKAIIEDYLPQQLTDAELREIIVQAIKALPEIGSQSLGRVIAEVRQKTNGRAESGRIAAFVKEELQKQ